MFCIGCVTESSVYLCESFLGDGRRISNHEAASVVEVQLILTKALLPYCNIQG